ncbi:4-(cytidine 5'-diphospho)-2-C-methyl-D-erythritol kinase [Clostridium sp. 'deep sea']|uniref:4-(cytidine 5'-diphospho)-2-C-methyl-D-erythritol kinase n=1 Tax=Clostridium sp. 'deep sea' TaxID=2779445 RepID=UPI0018966E42|nr:4-(cytidine 5'-diphospho)-2-C-methyl-D-erythritol kinase [Clostridium sp. 'deep sea']QOR34506.1 4-(cytidine 5'-diphospho)-2-C-methyl-D-erythritol kinase [Clostridium sp. 'deep sea']
MAKYVNIKAPAKLNLGLNITGIIENQYHTIDTIFISVDLYDSIKLTLSDKISVKCKHCLVPNDSNNIAYKAAELLRKQYSVNKGVEIIIDKKIPVGGGMAGGSSNAAAVLRALPLLWNINVDIIQLKQIALSLGADVWYCYIGGIQRGQGIGSELTSINSNISLKLAILPQPWSFNTAAVFKAYDNLKIKQNINVSAIKEAILKQDVKKLNEKLGNSLELAVSSIEPSLLTILKNLRNYGLNVQMTGSGSTLYLVLSSENDIIKLNKYYNGKVIVCNLLPILPKAKLYTI